MHYYQFNIKDWALHTAHLSLEEESAYLRLINFYYDTEKPINNANLDRIFRRCRIPQDIGCFILSEYFLCDDEENWTHKRCEQELAKYHAMADGGRKGAALRWKKPSDSPPNPPPMLTKNQEPITINHSKNIPIPEGMNVVVWSDYLKLRNRQKKPLTETALKGLQREADKAKMPLVDVLQTCCERGWIGFKADWLDSKQTTKAGGQEWRNNDALMIAKATELGLSTIGMQRYDIINKIDAHMRSRGL